MPAFLLTIVAFLGGWRNLVAASLIAGAVGTAAYYVHQYDKRGTEIAILKRQLGEKNSALEVARINIELANRAAEALNTRLAQRDVDLEAFCKILNTIEADTDPGADGPVGSPVDKALEALKQLDDNKAKKEEKPQ